MRLWKSLWLWLSVLVVVIYSPSTFCTIDTGIKDSLLDVLSDGGFDIFDKFSLTRPDFGVLNVLKALPLKVLTLGFSSALHGQKFNRQLLGMFESITEHLERIQSSVGELKMAANLRNLYKDKRDLIQWEISLNTLEEYMRPINSLFHKFVYYQKHKMEVGNETLMNFAENGVSHSTNSIQTLMANIHSMTTSSELPSMMRVGPYSKDEYDMHKNITVKMPNSLQKLFSDYPTKELSVEVQMWQGLTLRPSIFWMLGDTLNRTGSCYKKQSPQHIVYGFYTLIALMLARGYSMINFSYDILMFYDKGDYMLEQQLANDFYIRQIWDLLKNTLSVMGSASDAYTTCDPAKHIEGQTFVMVTELLQGYMENEVDLNSLNNCGYSCSSFNYAKVENCYDSRFCKTHRQCTAGELHDCRYVASDAEACISSVPYRRYDWIQYGNGKKFGTGSTCKNQTQAYSWNRWIFYECSYCFCLCDDPTSPTSDRFISLRPVLSDTARDMIVTGVRFTKKNRVIHIQVQQGEAMPQNQVKRDTVQWVEVEPISVGPEKFVENVDYITLKYGTRNINLDRLKGPEDHVVTGLKFKMHGSHLSLKVRVTPMNFTTGKMVPSSSFWIANDNVPNTFRKELELVDPDDPRRSLLQSIIDTRSDMFVTLQPTSMNGDAAQLTVPFFDAQPISPSPITWLQGIELYHRGRKGYGGFIGLKVLTYNLTKLFMKEFHSKLTLANYDSNFLPPSHSQPELISGAETTLLTKLSVISFITTVLYSYFTRF